MLRLRVPDDPDHSITLIETLEPKVGEGSFDREQPPSPPDERIADSLGRALRSAALQSVAFVLIAIGIPFALLTSLRSEGLGSRGEMIPVATIAAAWLVLLRRSIPRWRALVHDRRDGRLAFVDGAVWIEARPSKG